MIETVSSENIKKIATLSHLKLKDEELENLTLDFNRILEFFSHLEEVDTENVQALEHVHDKVNAEREDNATPSLPEDTIENLAPQMKNNMFVVPQVIE